MSSPSDPVARVYAAALIEIGRETNSLGALHDELVQLRKLYDGDRWFRSFFASPRIDREVKWAAVRTAVEGKMSRPVVGLLCALIHKGRESVLDNVVDQFDKFKDLAENRLHAYLTVAHAVPEDIRRSLTGRLVAATGKNVQLHERVDPAALGGAALRVGDRVIDRTLRTRLSAMRRELLTTR